MFLPSYSDLALVLLWSIRSFVSIRAPTRGAMATQSKIRLFREQSPPHRSKKSTLFWESVPTFASLRTFSPKENALEVRTQTFLLAHLTIICVAVAKFRSSRQTTFFWSNYVTQPSDVFDLNAQSTISPSLSFGLSTKHQSQKV